MCPPWLEGAHTGAPLQDRGFSYFYERNLVLGGFKNQQVEWIYGNYCIFL